MNILKIILLNIFILFLTSCNSSDDSDNGSQTPETFQLNMDNFVGTYELNYYELTSDTWRYFSGLGDEYIVSSRDVSGGDFQNVTYVFNPDNTYMFSGQYTETIRTRIFQDPVQITDETVVLDNSGTYLLSEQNRILGLDEEVVYRIELFDNNTLHLTGTFTNEITFNETVRGTFEYRFTRL